MTYGLVQVPLIALRAQAAEESELITQLLYGETVKIVETAERWLFVENATDGETGWIDRKTITSVSEQTFNDLRASFKYRVYCPFADCWNDKTDERLLLAGGSIIHDFDKIQILGNNANFQINPTGLLDVPQATGEETVRLASQYMNAPYLWGGKSMFGIDCSGLVQVVFSVFGIQLPRMSRSQAKVGETVHFLTDAKAGDLAFFGEEEGHISHVGILLDNEHIIHASGWVKTEKVDAEGIISGVTSAHTHKLRVIKRIIEI